MVCHPSCFGKHSDRSICTVRHTDTTGCDLGESKMTVSIARFSLGFGLVLALVHYFFAVSFIVASCFCFVTYLFLICSPPFKAPAAATNPQGLPISLLLNNIFSPYRQLEYWCFAFGRSLLRPSQLTSWFRFPPPACCVQSTNLFLSVSSASVGTKQSRKDICASHIRRVRAMISLR